MDTTKFRFNNSKSNDVELHPFIDSTAFLSDPEKLKKRLEQNGYLFLRGLLPKTDVLEVQYAFKHALVDSGVLQPDESGRSLRPGCFPFREGDDAYFSVHDKVYSLEVFHALAHHPALMCLMAQVLGEGAFPHPLSIIRMVFPEHTPATTPPHQDFPNNQGSKRLTAAWIPLMDCPVELGPLRVLSGSRHLGVLPLQYHLGPGNRAAKLPRLARDLKWHCSSFELGDVLIFDALTVHAACHNLTPDSLRLSVDYRYQPAGDSLTEICLKPHFERLSWAEIYSSWSRKDLQYYWLDKKYKKVPWDDALHKLSPEDAKEGLRMALEYAAHRGDITIDLSGALKE